MKEWMVRLKMILCLCMSKIGMIPKTVHVQKLRTSLRSSTVHFADKIY